MSAALTELGPPDIDERSRQIHPDMIGNVDDMADNTEQKRQEITKIDLSGKSGHELPLLVVSSAATLPNGLDIVEDNEARPLAVLSPPTTSWSPRSQWCLPPVVRSLVNVSNDAGDHRPGNRMWLAIPMSGLEPHITRVLTQAGQKLFGSVKNRRARVRTRSSARTLVAQQVAEGLFAELNQDQAHRLYQYLASPDFEEVVLQYFLGQLLGDVPWDDLRTNIRHEILFGLRHNVELPASLLTTTADVVFDAVAIGSHEELKWVSSRQVTPAVTAAAAHLAAAADANSQLLRDLGGLAEVHKFAQQIREQVVALHRHMRLPHLGASRSVPYAQLYVPPVLLSDHEGNEAPDLATVALPGRRSVLLGDPGAGKSTLAAKLAHDVAADLVPGAEGRVPFLLVLRDLTGSFREGGKGLAHYLAQVCQDPYNLEPPPHAIEYLLRNGRAMVLLDGLDELVEPALRRKVVQLVDGFVNRFPLVPVLVTARRVGYYDAALDRDSFTVGRVAELNDDQVKQYATRWFGLDESIAEAKREQMALSFMAESHNIAELRRNPLLLALLCAM